MDKPKSLEVQASGSGIWKELIGVHPTIKQENVEISPH